jgi:hypothetical protein
MLAVVGSLSQIPQSQKERVCGQIAAHNVAIPCNGFLHSSAAFSGMWAAVMTAKELH